MLWRNTLSLKRRIIMKFLVTGGAGYIGQLVCSELKKEGHEIIVVDVNLFDQKTPYLLIEQELNELLDNFRKLNVDGVIHLAAIVGEPACTLNPERAFEYNYKTTKRLAEKCREHNTRIIYASTCSVYGNQEGLLTEESKVAPVDFYGQTRLLGEKEILKNEKNVSLRFGTVYGWAPRMRFDLVINKFAARAATGLPLEVFGGKQNRPFTHVEDVARATVFFATHPEFRGVHNIVHENYSLNEAAEKISRTLNGKVSIISGQEDNRNYIVSNKKLLSTGFIFKRKFEEAIKEIAENIIKNRVDYTNNVYYNDKYIQEKNR